MIFYCIKHASHLDRKMYTYIVMLQHQNRVIFYNYYFSPCDVKLVYHNFCSCNIKYNM